MKVEPTTQDLLALLFGLRRTTPTVEGLGLDGQGRIAVRARRGAAVALPERALGRPVVALMAPEPPSVGGWTLPPPIRIAGDRRPAGTLGAVVWRGGEPLVLANAHVLVPAYALVRDNPTPSCPALVMPVGTPMAVGRPFVRRGHLDRFIPMTTGGIAPNLADAAVATWDRPLPDHQCGGTAEAKPGVMVAKRGVGDSRIRGGPIVLHRAVWVLTTREYGCRDQGSAFVFAEQVVVNLRQSGGDSGAVCRDVDGAAVALLHARIGATLALATPARQVEALLGVTFGGVRATAGRPPAPTPGRRPRG